MQRATINWNKTYQGTKQYLDHHNRMIEMQDPGYTYKDTLRVHGNLRATAFDLTRIWCQQASDYLGQGGDPNNMIGLRTFTVSLAGLRDVSERTIQRHKQRLKDIGFIKSEKMLGSEGTEIHLNPEIIANGLQIPHPDAVHFQAQPPAQPTPEPTPKNTPEAFKNLMTNILSGFSASTTCTNKNKLSVDKAELQGKPKGITTCTRPEPDLNTPQAETECDQNQKSCAKKVQKIHPIAENAAPEKVQDTQNGAVCFTFAKELAKNFCILALQLLWPNRPMAKPEKNILWRNMIDHYWGGLDVYHTESEWVSHYERCSKALYKAKEWFDLHPEVEPPSPDWYFHGNNTKMGFGRALYWLQTDTHRAYMANIRREITLHKKGKGRWANQGILHLFRVHESRTAATKDHRLQEIFYSLSNKLYKV